jgi:hypothetical protein
VLAAGTVDLAHVARYGGVMRISGMARVWSGRGFPSKLKFAVAGECGSRQGALGGCVSSGCFGWIEEKSPLKNQWDMA